MSVGEQTPRVGAGSQRGFPPATAMGSSFGSPATQISGNGSVPRPSRLPRNHSTSGHPLSYPVNPNVSSHGLGSTSRSTSRARPPLSTQNTAFQVATLSRQAATLGEVDDEEPIVDRGEDLIRRRQAERKQARRKKEREKRGGGDFETSGGGTIDDGVMQAQQRSLGPAAGRSVSRSRAPSATRGPRREGVEGYFASYAGSLAGSETPTQVPGDMLSPRAALRPASIYSSAADEDEEEEAEREREMEDVVADVVESATADGGSDDPEDDDEDDEDAEEGSSEEGVTLRDRQDVS
jgi:Ca2+:H+ antiporter